MRPWRLVLALIVAVALANALGPIRTVAAADPVADTVGFVDPSTGEWHLRGPDGWVTSFYYGNPGDTPMVGDWDCDGVDTPGLYRRSDGFVYLRNSNTQGVADVRFFFGNPGDVPLAGDFDGDGCDTVSIHRPSEGRVFIINELGADDGGLGAAEFDYYFGDPGDQAFVGDFDGDGIDTIGLHRASTGFVYYRNSHTQGIADKQFFFGDPGDRFVAGDWTGDDIDAPGVFRPTDRRLYLRYTNTQGNADRTITMGDDGWLPVAGAFGLPDRPLEERTWSIHAVDDLGYPGRFNDIAIGNDGLPIVSYGFPLGLAYHELRTAHCDDVACSRAEIAALYGAMFESTSIAIPPTGYPVVAFHDPASQGILLARCDDSACKSVRIEPLEGFYWSPTRKYVEARFTTDGALVLGTSGGGNPVVHVQVGDVWEQRVLCDFAGDQSRLGLALGHGDLPRLAFTPPPYGPPYGTELTFPTDLASCGDTVCTFGLIEFREIHHIVAEAADLGVSELGDAHTSVTELGNGFAAVAISWRDGPGLDLVTCLDDSCDTAKTVRIDPAPRSGRFVDLETTADGTAILAWATREGDVRIARCLDSSCTDFEAATIASLGVTGVEVSLAIDWTGTPIVAYHDPVAGALMVARLH